MITFVAEQFASPRPKRRWFQFSLRGLLAMVFVLCLPLAWLAVKLDAKRRERAALAALGLAPSDVRVLPFAGQRREPNGHFHYDWFFKPDNEPPGPRWLRRLLGHDFFGIVVSLVVHDPAVSNADLEHLRSLPALRLLYVLNANITDAGLAHVGCLSELRNPVSRQRSHHRCRPEADRTIDQTTRTSN
jgi:hypothetical protein